MFEGKNIHFSPLDNKPLCSYSSKLCRQRRLNGYAFCIRHILEDKSAPFKQCGFVTRNNSQKCLNAIPSNQQRGFCHSHMQKVVSIPDTTTKTSTTIFPSGGNRTTLNNDNNNKSSVLLSSSSPLIKNCLNLYSSIVRDDLQNKETVSKGDSFATQDKISNNLHKAYESSLSSSTSSLSSSSSSSSTTSNNNNNNIIVSSNTTTTSSTSTTTIFATSTSNTASIVKSSYGTNSQNTTFQKGKPTTTTTTTFPSSFNISSSNIINNSGFKVICEKPVNNNNSIISSSISNNNKTNNNVNNKSVNLQNSLSTVSSINQKSKIESENPERYNLNNNNNNSSTKKVRNNIIVTTYSDNNKQLIIGNQPNLKKKPQFHSKPPVVNNNIIINNNNNNKNNNKNIQFGTTDNKLTTSTINATNNVSAQQSNNNNNNSSTITLCVRDRWKKFKFNPKIGGDEDIKPALQLEHMKTIKILEKLPLFAESGNKCDDKCHVKLEHVGNKLGKRSSFSTLPISSGIEILLVPPFLSKSKSNHANNNNANNKIKNKTTKTEIKQEHAITATNGIEKGQTENGVESSSSNDSLHNYFKSYTKIKIEDGNCENDNKKISQSKEDCLQPWEWETRKEFLARVRRAFKRQYKTITKASKLSEKQDKSDKAFREALVTCALNDSSRCAQILVSDPRFEETDMLTGKRGGEVEIKKENEIQFGNTIRMNNIKNSNSMNSTSTGSTDSKSSIKSSFSQNPNDKSRVKKLLNGKISPEVGKTNSVRLNNGFDNDSICDTQIIVNTKSGINNNNKLNNLASGNYLWPNGCNSNSSSSSSAENLPDSSKTLKANKKLSKGNRDLNGNNHQFSIKSYVDPNQTLNGINNSSFVKTSKNTLNGNCVPSPKKKAKKASTSPTSLKSSFKKRKVDSDNSELVSDLDFNNQQSNNGQQLDSMVLESSHDDDNLLRSSLNSHEQLLSVPSSSSSSSVDHLQSVSNLETVLGSVSSSEAATTDASFDSPFDHSTSSQPDVGEFSDDDLENSFELQLDPEITHQASRLLEDNGLTEDDFNDLFPETRMGDHKMNGDLGIDFSSNFDTTDIHYDSLFANIFPSFRTNMGQPESISVNHQF